MSYTKLFSHIITSSVWSENDQTRVLWVTMLALSNKYGEVMAAIPGLAKVASLSIEATEAGIARLMSPDKHSRTKDEAGRRISEIDGGWHIINYEKHRRMASFDEKKERNRERQRRFRERHKPNAHVTEHNDSVTHGNGDITPNNAKITPLIDNAEAEAEVPSTLKLSSVGHVAKPKKPSASHKGPTLTDDLFLSELKRHYPDINIERELRKMDAWLLTPQARGRKRTRRFVVNWLNKCDAPMHQGNGQKESKSGQWLGGDNRVTPIYE